MCASCIDLSRQCRNDFELKRTASPTKRFRLVMIGDPSIIEGIIERDVRDALNMIASAPLPGEGQAAPEDDEGDAE